MTQAIGTAITRAICLGTGAQKMGYELIVLEEGVNRQHCEIFIILKSLF